MLLYYPQYCAAAVAATGILLVMYFMKRNYPTKRNRLFLVMLVNNLLASGINITTFYTISFPDRYPLWVLYATNLVYLFIYNMMAVLFLLYVDSVTKIPRFRIFMQVVAYVIAVYTVLLLLTSPWTHLAIYFDQDLNYRYGPLMFTLYITAFVSVAVANILFLLVRKKFNTYQVFSITGFVLAVFASVIYQVYHPAYAISNFVCSMVLFFLYTAFENQAYFLYGDTPCYNLRAFVRTIHQNKKREKSYNVTYIKIDNFENVVHLLGRTGAELWSERIAERISYSFGRAAYCIDVQSFALVNESSRTKEHISEKIAKCFSEPFLLEIDSELHSIQATPALFFLPITTESVDGFEMAELLTNLQEHDSKEIVQITDVAQRLEPIRREKEVLRIIDKALQNQSFQVYYQPILDVHTGKFVSSEALVRLIDNEQGFISPEEFIPIAERNGRINEIGSYVFQEVCRFMRDTNIAAFGVHYIEINLSPAQCKKIEVVEKLLKTMTDYGIRPEQLNLEITETAEMEDHGMESVNHIMQRLHNRGITFSLDDFGSGFAALNYLMGLPVDIVKIDKGILWQAMKDPSSMSVLMNTIKMIKDVGRKIVVEGVETEEMATLLIEHGCDYLQGYLYSKPLPGEDYLRFLAEA